MSWYAWVVFAPLLAMLVWAAVEDVRHRRIPNWLTLAMAATGVMQSFTAYPAVAPAQALLGLLVGLGLTIVLFAFGAVGGGDVKLVAAAGAWIGPLNVFTMFVVTALVGMVIVLVQAAWQGRLRTLLRNTVVLAINIVHVNELGVEHAQATGESCKSVDKPLPYAVSVLIAVVGTLMLGRGLV